MTTISMERMSTMLATTRADRVVHCPARRVSMGPGFHYFGYYDKCPWSGDGQLLACMRPAFVDHHPQPDEGVEVGVIDPDSQRLFKPLDRSLAWNWQQGCMLRWLPPAHEQLMFNERVDGQHVTAALDVRSGKRRILFDRPTYDISDDGLRVASLNFERVGRCRPGYGYNTTNAPEKPLEKQPADDGLFLIDPATGQATLAVSIRDAARVGVFKPGRDERAWFNHLKFNPSGTKLLFLHRWASHVCSGHSGFTTRVMMLDLATGRFDCLCEGMGASHFDWQDDRHLLIFLYHPKGDGFYLIDVVDRSLRRLSPQRLAVDGHCVYRPQRDWLATDTYPLGEQGLQTLSLFHPRSCTRVDIGGYAAVPTADPALRCDLHARWDRQGTQLCFDSTHEGSRQMYVVDVSQVVNADLS